jgi:hypothetical protein
MRSQAIMHVVIARLGAEPRTRLFVLIQVADNSVGQRFPERTES